ncbi:D-alanyl-D-alanine carboxypeptidase [Roseivirga sp.]|uniref:D-alanyl-D-alanine carboxypeptidase n=1 Tax=Roseivirga sp. TaxID=1964215 RepID=UPI003B8B42F9
MKRSICCLLVLFLIISVPSFGQKYPKRKIFKDLKSLPGFENAFIGFKLVDPVKDKVIAEQYAHKHMTPASTTKLFTYQAGVQFLPEKLPALEYYITGDSLIFWSTGYPLTLHPDHPDSTVIKFLSQSDKDLYYWSRPIEDDRFGPGWGWDDYSAYYGAEKSSFPIYGNSVQFILNSEKKEFYTEPSSQEWEYHFDTVNSDRSRVKRDEIKNDFKINYRKISQQDTLKIDTLVRPFIYSDKLFIDLLSNATKKSIKTVQKTSRPLAFETLQGVKADSLYKWMLQPSDNLFAEQILLMISGVTNDTLSSENALKQLKARGSILVNDQLERDQLTWRDGSGLSRYNMFSPNELTQLLSSLDIETILPLLPQGSVSGSLEDWYTPNVYAKTGTLSNNHSLAGYIKTDKGKTLIFTIMANHYTAPTAVIRHSIGIILNKIKRAY